MTASKEIRMNKFTIKHKYDKLKQKIKELDKHYLKNLEAYVKAKKELCEQLERLHKESIVAAYLKENKLKLTKEI